jgi:hypothetical protein
MSRKDVADVQPGEAEMVEFTPKIFEAGPEKWSEKEGGEFAEAGSGRADKRDKQARPKAEDCPKRECGGAENIPEKGCLEGTADPNGKAEIKCGAGGREPTELKQADEINEDERTQRTESVREMKGKDGQSSEDNSADDGQNVCVLWYDLWIRIV